MIFVLTFLNFAFGTHSNGICLDSRHLVLGLRVQSTSVLGIPIWTSYFDILQIIQLDHVIITKVNNHWKSF